MLSATGWGAQQWWTIARYLDAYLLAMYATETEISVCVAYIASIQVFFLYFAVALAEGSIASYGQQAGHHTARHRTHNFQQYGVEMLLREIQMAKGITAISPNNSPDQVTSPEGMRSPTS